MEEIHKDIKGYEDLYSITNFGRIYSKRNGIYLTLDKSVQPQTTYLRAVFQDNGRIERHLVHRLVAEYFIPNPELKPCVNHIDNNGSNNHISNLEWCTYSENLQHAQNQGRLFVAQSKGGKAAAAKVYEQIDEQVNSMIGQQYGLWRVDSFANKVPIGSQGMFRFNLNVTCTGCNTTSEVDKNLLLAGKSLGCLKCRTAQAGEERTLKTLEALKNTQKDHWLISDYFFEEGKQMLDCTCMLCGKQTIWKKQNLIGRPMRKCKKCNCKS